ncbi:hypothetical protein [Enterovibrio nigricans]|uniref:Uncharacterized protein n=1 Tax=Enterovibrio nigricans DSM 22720 TaxID=1121868 RepID=A0A1T4VR39_9GAMM|nr:hypothetical protein [Enterovibrio nigricans]PKF48787.1 hypothetical protein AT251_23595 [Enterovibrio nigricans]SKA67426.1 hypothetical protein SAMN02745132_04211 [Enterovibrio nigricans DSM 22720]
MNATRCLIGVISLTQISACTIQTTPTKPLLLYNAKEAVKLSYCDDLANTAYQVSNDKLNGVSKQTQFAAISGDDSAQIKGALIDDIYRGDIKSSWQYSTNVFSECAQKVADIPTDRVEIASLCAQKSLVARGAADMYQSGKVILDTYTAFAPYKTVRPFTVIEDVYDEGLSRAQASKQAWQECMGVVSD